MKPIKIQEKKDTASTDVVSRALASIYTGVFSIDLVCDSYAIITSPKEIASMLEEIRSAQQAINFADRKSTRLNSSHP